MKEIQDFLVGPFAQAYSVSQSVLSRGYVRGRVGELFERFEVETMRILEEIMGFCGQVY